MKKIKLVMLILLIITFSGVLVQANESIYNNTQSIDQNKNNSLKINFIGDHSDELLSQNITQLKKSDTPKTQGSVQNKIALIFGILMVIGGPVLAAGGGVMVYFNAEGLHLFDDKTITVSFWGNNYAYGWLGLGFGIAFIVLGTAMLIGGICLIIISFIPNNRRTQLFIESDIYNKAANVGFRIKL